MAVIEKATADNLITSNAHPITGQTVVVASGEGELKRGSVLMRKSNGKYALAGDSSGTKFGTAEVILAADVDATSADAVAEVYNSGEFNANELIVTEGYTMDEEDLATLKNAGVYVVASVN